MTWILLVANVVVLGSIAVACRRATLEDRRQRSARLASRSSRQPEVLHAA